MNTTLNAYQLKAQATRSRRTYNRPTKGQEEAYRKLIARDGRKSLTQEDCYALATHPYLTSSQRAEFFAMAVAKGW